MSKPTAFPLDESRLPFEIPRDEPYREKIARLGQMITDRIPAKKGILTKDDPEYWGLASIVTDEMADVALKMKVRKPMTLPELVKATGKPAGELEPLLQQMAVVGLLEYNWENPRREKQYILPMFVPGSAEFFNMNKQQIADHPEVTAFFERMTFLPLEHITAMVPPGGAGIGMHVIPVEKAIETENRSADIEHISHWLKKYDGKYAAGPCSCRMSRAAMGEGCGDDPDDWCIGVGDMADYLVETNKGHYVTYDEVMQILQKAEDNGFVHQITNIDGENKIFAICNCNVNVCNALRTSQLFNTPNMSRSAYVARVEPENCVACGRCVEYCPAGAVKLGQKLCTKDGPITYPKQELPDAVKWGPDKWAIDYRDKNRINCYDTGTAPCKTACPAHIAVQGYLKMAAQGRYRDALTYQTAQPDIFVGGDVCTGPRFAIDAIAAGKQGAISIHRFVQPNTSLTIGRNRRDFHELDKSNLALGEYDRAPHQSAALDAGIDAHRSFRDAHLTLTEDQVKIETARCLGCGASVVDPNKCIGCGVCTTKCEFDAIRLHRDLPECSKMVRSEDKFKAILPYMAKREIKIRFAKKEK